jgi:hypothetical protein
MCSLHLARDIWKYGRTPPFSFELDAFVLLALPLLLALAKFVAETTVGSLYPFSSLFQ